MTQIDLSTLGYSRAQADALHGMIQTGHSNVITGFVGSMKIPLGRGIRTAEQQAAVMAEKERRQVKFLPIQVIRRILTSVAHQSAGVGTIVR